MGKNKGSLVKKTQRPCVEEKDDVFSNYVSR